MRSAPSWSRLAAAGPKWRARVEATASRPVTRPSTIIGAVTSDRIPARASAPRPARAIIRSSLITGPGSGAADGKISSVRTRSGRQCAPPVSPTAVRTSHMVSSEVANAM